ncbi:hypothetical protein CY35_03G071800, partial [Sphagnum magellanicum]
MCTSWSLTVQGRRGFCSVLAFGHVPVLQQPSRNHLSKHMEHLPFTSAFWVLQVIVSLRCKFQGVYTQKQLIGSKKDSSVCCHNTGISFHPSDHTSDSAP